LEALTKYRQFSNSGIKKMIHAILFDVDGTLYRQRAMRLRMLLALLKFTLTSPVQGMLTLHGLYRFRTIREVLRFQVRENELIEDLQYRLPAEKTGMTETKIRKIVFEWIYQRSLDHIWKFKYDGMAEFLERCKKKGLLVGAFSDYPAREKIAALGLDSYFDLYLCSTDKDINAFKPSPAGIRAACKIWNLPPGSILYVGDRMDTDSVAANKAGTCFYHFKNNIDELESWISKHT